MGEAKRRRNNGGRYGAISDAERQKMFGEEFACANRESRRIIEIALVCYAESVLGRPIADGERISDDIKRSPIGHRLLQEHFSLSNMQVSMANIEAEWARMSSYRWHALEVIRDAAPDLYVPAKKILEDRFCDGWTSNLLNQFTQGLASVLGMADVQPAEMKQACADVGNALDGEIAMRDRPASGH